MQIHFHFRCRAFGIEHPQPLAGLSPPYCMPCDVSLIPCNYVTFVCHVLYPRIHLHAAAYTRRPQLA